MTEALNAAHGSVFGAAPMLINAVATQDGAAAITSTSQEQLDELSRRAGTVVWEHHEGFLWLGHNSRQGIVPLARFDLRQRTHRLALRDVVDRGTLHVCAAETVTDGMVGGGLAVDVRQMDIVMIEVALA
jgi:hypothetical protein